MLEIFEELTSDDAKNARCYLRRIACGAIVLFVVACTATYYTKAHAADSATLVAEIEGNKLFLFHEPCSLGGWFTKWKKARWDYEGKSFEACWRLQLGPDGLYVETVDANGDAGSVPTPFFKTVEAI